MDKKLLTSICNQVYSRFPEVKGCSPQIQPHGDTGQVLIFKGQATGADGKTIPRVVRVVVNTDGKIAKITTSR
jgi:hypothetical protein